MDSETKPCVACANLIPSAAKLCSHCSTYQDWRQHLVFGNTTLALMVALLAITGSVLTFLKDAAVPNSRLVLSDTRFLNGEVQITVANLGERPGLLHSLEFTYDASGPSYSIGNLMTPYQPDDLRLAAGEVRVLRYPAPDVDDGVSEAPHSVPATCHLSVVLVEFLGEERNLQRDFDCRYRGHLVKRIFDAADIPSAD